MQWIIITAIIFSIGVPLWHAWRIWRMDSSSRADWFITTADAAAMVAVVMLLSRWDVAGFQTRAVLLGILLLSCALSWRRHSARGWHVVEFREVLRHNRATLASLVFFGAMLSYIVSSLIAAPLARDLAFPLEQGRFVIVHGGGNGLLNRHANHHEQRRAVDIVAVDSTGFRAQGFLPAELDSYAIHGATVVSPCDGIVATTEDGHPDLIPPNRDPGTASGNHVVVDCGDVRVEMAHLQSGSISVEEGARIAVGDELGKVGNSGNTTEPHLHMHALNPESRRGIEISLDGQRPFRNRIFVR